MSIHDAMGLLALIEVAHAATTKAEFRHSVVHGVGSLIEPSIGRDRRLDAMASVAKRRNTPMCVFRGARDGC